MSTITVERCSCCRAKIEPEVLEAQRKHGDFTEGADCRDCLESVPDNPQMQNLFTEIRDGLSDENTEKWDDLDREDRVLFAMQLINEGIAEGGSPGFHEQLRKYACLLLADNNEAGEGAA